RPRWVWVHGPHLNDPREETSVIYRNIDDETVRNNYKFGINIVVHLLTRYQKHFRFLPKELPKIEMPKNLGKKKEEIKPDETKDKSKPKSAEK
ncbi:MAG: hypothetical protein Q7J98_13975, partial [Kiritimatiellia bacterium]|nr:hypothetical protein [Kiritimatiellia bacterium]